MSMREIRQEEAVQAYMESDGRSIINACPRFGKIKVAIDIMKKKDIESLLLIAPRNDIFKGWYDDFQKFGWRPPSIMESTFASIKKLKDEAIDAQLIIIDEPHELSINQQNDLAKVVHDTPILGLTGTMTQKTREELYESLILDVCYKYTIAQGVAEGILADYQIFVHRIPMDDSKYNYSTKSKKYTERGYFNLQEYLKKEAKDARSKHMFNLKMINIIQNSYAKMLQTKKLIHQYNDERLLVFCGVTEVADNLGIPVYHSKAREKEIFEQFCSGIGKHLATIKMMQAGITVTPIRRGIINYMSGNPEDSAQKICRFLGFEYDNPEKKATLHIVCTNEEFELVRLKTGLLFFEQEKIKFL